MQIPDTRASVVDGGCSNSRFVQQSLTAPQCRTSSMLVDRRIVDVIEAHYSKTVGSANEQNATDMARSPTATCEQVERLMMVARPSERVPSPAVGDAGRISLSPQRWHLKKATTIPFNRIIVASTLWFLLKDYHYA